MGKVGVSLYSFSPPRTSLAGLKSSLAENIERLESELKDHRDTTLTVWGGGVDPALPQILVPEITIPVSAFAVILHCEVVFDPKFPSRSLLDWSCSHPPLERQAHQKHPITSWKGHPCCHRYNMVGNCEPR